MLVINSIEKSRLQSDSWSYSGGGVAWTARFVLFLGFALLAGGLAGGVVRSLFFSFFFFNLFPCFLGWLFGGDDGDGG